MFKEGYQKEMNGIKPRKEFLDDLAGKMKEEEAIVSKSRPSYMKWYYGTIAATLVICFVGGFSIFYFNSDNQDNIMDLQAGIAGKPHQNFENDTWYGDETESKVKYQMMMDRINGDKEVVFLASETSSFSEEDVLDEAAKEELYEALSSVVYVNDELAESDNVMNYMIEFTDGTTIKFQIIDGTYFYNEEIGSTFRLKE